MRGDFDEDEFEDYDLRPGVDYSDTLSDGYGLLPFVRMAHAILGNLSLPLADRVDAAYAVLDKLLTKVTGETR